MSRFEDYYDKYETIKMERERGILTLTFHTSGGSLQWGGTPHREFPRAFRDVAEDSRNLVVIMTGTGLEFSGSRGFKVGAPDQFGSVKLTNYQRDVFRKEAKDLLLQLLSIEVPVISAVNGPAWRHAEIPLLADIALATEDTQFQDSAHFVNGLVPGDGQHVILPMAIGINRARYYLLTGQVLDAEEARRIGLVSEVLPRAELMPRAKAIAETILKQPPSVVRNTRLILIEQIKRRMLEYFELGLTLQLLSAEPDDS